MYKLSEVGQAIESNDLNAASSVLGASTDTEWIKNANSALTKVCPYCSFIEYRNECVRV